MLVAQMIATHNAVMSCFAQVTHQKLIAVVNDSITSVTKLTRTYLMQMEALNKYRGNGQQNISVKHVHVNEGGQAIVGNVKSDKKS